MNLILQGTITHKNIDKKIEDLKQIKKLREKNRELDDEINKSQFKDKFFD